MPTIHVNFASNSQGAILSVRHSPVWTLRWALRWDDLPYIFPQPVNGQQCLFSRDSCLPDAALFLTRLSPTFSRQFPRSTFSTFSCVPVSPPLIHLLLPAMLLGLHLFKSNKIIATISKVLLSWFSFNVSSAWPDGRLGKQSADTSTSDITGASPIKQNRKAKNRKVIINLDTKKKECNPPGNVVNHPHVSSSMWLFRKRCAFFMRTQGG